MWRRGQWLWWHKKSFADNNIHYLWIRDGDLWVADAGNPSIGLHYVGLDKSSVFIRLPREASLGIMNNGRSLCMAMRTCALTQPQSLLRGTHNQVFTEDGKKVLLHWCAGSEGKERCQVWSLQAKSRISKWALGYIAQGYEACRVCIWHVHGHRNNSTHLIGKVLCQFHNDGAITLLIKQKKHVITMDLALELMFTWEVISMRILLCLLFKLTLTTTLINLNNGNVRPGRCGGPEGHEM